MKECLETILRLLGDNAVAIINMVLSVLLVLIYIKQTRILKEQTKIIEKQTVIQKEQTNSQATSTNLAAADRLQSLYDAYYNLCSFLFSSRNEMLMASLVAIWNTKERNTHFAKFRDNYIKEISKVEFFVSKQTLAELREYRDFSLEYWNALLNLHQVIVPSYNELTGEYDDVYRIFQDSERTVSVRSFMKDISSVDKQYEYAYMEFADKNDEFESKSKVLLDKFKAKEGLGSII